MWYTCVAVTRGCKRQAAQRPQALQGRYDVAHTCTCLPKLCIHLSRGKGSDIASSTCCNTRVMHTCKRACVAQLSAHTHTPIPMQDIMNPNHEGYMMPEYDVAYGRTHEWNANHPMLSYIRWCASLGFQMTSRPTLLRACARLCARSSVHVWVGMVRQ